MIIFLTFAAAAATSALAVPAALPVAKADQIVPTNAPQPVTLRAGTIVDFEITDRLNSKLSRIGDSFGIRLTEPVRVGDKAVIPAGATGRGEVIHSARARAGGKAGELIIAVRYFEVGSTRVPVRSFRFARSGVNNTGAGMVVAFVAGRLAYHVVGGEVDVPPGTAGNAKVAADTILAFSAHMASTRGE